MNSKKKTLSFEIAPNDAWQEVACGASRRTRARHVNGIAFHKDKAGTAPERFSLRVRLAANVIREVRWLTGDRVSVEIAPDFRQIRILRTNVEGDGWKLLSTNTAKTSSGESRTCYFKATLDESVLALIFPGDSKDYVPADDKWAFYGNAIVCALP